MNVFKPFKTLCMWLACVALLVPATSSALECPETSMTNTATNGRKLTTLTLGDDHDNSVTYNINQTANSGTCYFDMTEDGENFVTEPGATLSFTTIDWPYEWMHAYVFVDYNQNGEYLADLNSSTHKPNAGSELVSYSFYSFSTSDSYGYNSNGSYVSSSNHGQGKLASALPSWTLPEDMKPGIYTCLFKIDWNDITACGDQVGRSGGAWVEFNIEIPRNVPENLNEVCNFAGYAVGGSNNGRNLTTFSLWDGTNEQLYTVNQSTTTRSSVFYDLTDGDALETEQGKTIEFSEFNWEGSWMHYYLFVDYDQDGEYMADLNTSSTPYKMNDGNELVVYSYYNTNTNASSGYNSNGAYVSNNQNAADHLLPLKFTIPEDLTPGRYKCYLKIDWNNITQCGGEIERSCGVAVEFPIVVKEAATVDPEPGPGPGEETGLEGVWEAVAYPMDFTTDEPMDTPVTLKFNAVQTPDGNLAFTLSTNPNFVVVASYDPATKDLLFLKNQMGQLNGSTKYTQVSSALLHWMYGLFYQYFVGGTYNPETGALTNMFYKTGLTSTKGTLAGDPTYSGWGFGMAEYSTDRYTEYLPTNVEGYKIESFTRVGDGGGASGPLAINDLTFATTPEVDPLEAAVSFVLNTDEVEEGAVISVAYEVKAGDEAVLEEYVEEVEAGEYNFVIDLADLTAGTYTVVVKATATLESEEAEEEAVLAATEVTAGSFTIVEPELSIVSHKLTSDDEQAIVTAVLESDHLRGAEIVAECALDGGEPFAMTVDRLGNYVSHLFYIYTSAGTHTVTLKAHAKRGEKVVVETETVTVGNYTSTGMPDGIGSITTDGGNVRYFNLQGIEITAPVEGEVYIRVEGTQASKVVK